MTAFDAHLQPRDHDSAWRQASALLSDRPGVVIVAIVSAATIVCLAFLALVAGQELRFRAAQTIDGIQASVFLRPQAARTAAEALKGQFDSLPYVRNAVLHTKEAAIVALETSGLPQAANRSNPLPDVWVVTLAFDQAEPAKSLSDRVSEARLALARLPDVEAVDVDATWVATLDRWQRLSATGTRMGLAIGFPIVWLVLACLFYLAGRALSKRSQPDGGRPVAGFASVIVGVVVGVITLLAAAAIVAGVAYSLQSAGLDLKPIVVRIGLMGECIGALAASTILLAGATITIASRR